MTTQADHERAKAYALKVIVPPDRLEKIFENECNLAACYLDALRQIEALENDLAIANLAWKAENNRRKKVERETIERCAKVCDDYGLEYGIALARRLRALAPDRTAAKGE